MTPAQLSLTTRRVIQRAAHFMARTEPVAKCTQCGLHRVDVVTFDGQPTAGVLTRCTPWCQVCFDHDAAKDGLWVTALPGTAYGWAAQSLEVVVTGLIERGRYAGPEETS